MRVPRPHHSSVSPGALPRGITLLLAVLVTALVAVTLTVIPAPPAHAVASTGQGRGHLWKGDGVSWLGSYVMADGRFAFCLEVGKPSPIGNDYATTTSDDLPGSSESDTARLAYIARTWAASPDADTAAAGQLAVWTITGLGGHTQDYYAARANDHAGAVLTRARAMLDEAGREATTSVTARVRLSVPDGGGAILSADIVTNRVGSGATTVAEGTHQGAFTLVGATFADGETRSTLPNGKRVSIRPRTNLGIERVRADVSFRQLPYGRSVTVGRSASGSQALLFSANGAAARDDSVTATAVSPLPFQPLVVTQTSEETASAGAEITDRVDVRVRGGDGLLDEWGVYRSGDSFAPIPVTVRSRLLGPFADPPVEQAEWPDDAPVVCDVATVVERGAGSYRTAPCRLPETGHYVWVETIDPADTPTDKGRDRVRPWKSPFGVASEVSLVPEEPFEGLHPLITTRAAQSMVEPDVCVSDGLDVTDLDSGSGISFDVESLLVGPFMEPIVDGRDLERGFDDLPVAGTVHTTVTGAGHYDSPCVVVHDDGYYVFVYRSEGTAADAEGNRLVEPFSDLVAHRSEMVEARRPDEPTAPPTSPPVTPPTPSTPKPTTPPALAFTGSTGTGSTTLAGLGVVVLGGCALTVAALRRRAKTRRAELSQATEGQEGA